MSKKLYRTKKKQEAKRQETINAAKIDMTMFWLFLIFGLLLSGLWALSVCYLF